MSLLITMRYKAFDRSFRLIMTQMEGFIMAAKVVSMSKCPDRHVAQSVRQSPGLLVSN